MATTRVLLPTHLFADKPQEEDVVIALDPVFFTGPDGTFKIHKGKLAYLIAAAEEYAGLHGYRVMYPGEVSYPRGAVCYQPMDRFVEKKLRKAGVTMDGYPGFVLDPAAYDGPLKLVSVYKRAREASGILRGAKSMDHANRERPDERIAEERGPKKSLTKRMREAIRYVEAHYPDHYGDASACGYFPSTRRSALARLRKYASGGLKLMRYQDAMVANRGFLAHSVLSAAINVGLLHPAEVCRAIAGSDAGPSDKEGFVRQVLGWRELMAVVSVRRKRPIAFGRPKRSWYDGTTGIEPIDDCIGQALKTSYLHHIQRLMIVLNAMTLVGLGEGEMYRWFMEMVACDAFDWVMVGNIAVMGGFEKGVARKPYISGSAYVAKMSDGYGEEWKDKWDALFYDAAARHPYFRRVLQGKKYKSRDWKRISERVKAALA